MTGGASSSHFWPQAPHAHDHREDGRVQERGGVAQDVVAQDDALGPRRLPPHNSDCVQSDVWDSAPEVRRRARGKQRPLLDPRPVIGPEPELSPEDLERSRADQVDDEPLGAEEATPETCTRTAPRKPGKAEVDKHIITHLPFRVGPKSKFPFSFAS